MFLYFFRNAAKNSSKHAKPIKKTQPAVDEKPRKLEPKATKQSFDLPAVQCKDTLLLDYDYSKQYSKRNVVRNWDKYAELPDDDDDNGQMSAADFEQLLFASKSIGDHFTFAAERSWLENDDQNQSDDNSIAADLFKLNISNLTNGIGSLPFYLRQGLDKELFTEDEIRDMNKKVKYVENEAKQALKIIPSSANVPTSAKEEKKNSNAISESTKTIEVKLPTQENPTKTFADTELINKLTETKLTPTTMIPNASNPITSLLSDTAKVKSNKTEDIQDWLDDILNES